jgi:hypothetical protein
MQLYIITQLNRSKCLPKRLANNFKHIAPHAVPRVVPQREMAVAQQDTHAAEEPDVHIDPVDGVADVHQVSSRSRPNSRKLRIYSQMGWTVRGSG